MGMPLDLKEEGVSPAEKGCVSLEEGTAYASPLRPQRVGGSGVTAGRGLEK